MSTFLFRFHISNSNTLDEHNEQRYYLSMIKSFADRETEKIFNREFSRKLPPEIQRRARVKLEILEAAEDLDE